MYRSKGPRPIRLVTKRPINGGEAPLEGSAPPIETGPKRAPPPRSRTENKMDRSPLERRAEHQAETHKRASTNQSNNETISISRPKS